MFGGGGVGVVWGDLSVEAAVVEPVDVFEGGECGVVQVLPGSSFVDQFCLVQTDRGFG